MCGSADTTQDKCKAAYVYFQEKQEPKAGEELSMDIAASGVICGIELLNEKRTTNV
ncbi:MAG TPA: DUF2283 domain-containing protein [Chloroflexi bacterium]|nr:DUF2283 domain-containing protein [Chloroflexota bacterium]